MSSEYKAETVRTIQT